MALTGVTEFEAALLGWQHDAANMGLTLAVTKMPDQLGLLLKLSDNSHCASLVVLPTEIYMTSSVNTLANMKYNQLLVELQEAQADSAKTTMKLNNLGAISSGYTTGSWLGFDKGAATTAGGGKLYWTDWTGDGSAKPIPVENIKYAGSYGGSLGEAPTGVKPSMSQLIESQNPKHIQSLDDMYETADWNSLQNDKKAKKLKLKSKPKKLTATEMKEKLETGGAIDLKALKAMQGLEKAKIVAQTAELYGLKSDAS